MRVSTAKNIFKIFAMVSSVYMVYKYYTVTTGIIRDNICHKVECHDIYEELPYNMVKVSVISNHEVVAHHTKDNDIERTSEPYDCYDGKSQYSTQCKDEVALVHLMLLLVTIGGIVLVLEVLF